MKQNELYLFSFSNLNLFRLFFFLFIYNLIKYVGGFYFYRYLKKKGYRLVFIESILYYLSSRIRKDGWDKKKD